MNNKDPYGYYAILNVAPSATAEEIKKAYRRRAMELHPDRNKSADATVQFQKLNDAYAVLSDSAMRAEYDTKGLASESSSNNSESDEPSEPVVCSSCGCVTAQPRYVIFYEVKSFLVTAIRSGIQGVFCSGCAEKKVFKATVVTWLLGWWSVWGVIYSVQALFSNMMGGKQPAVINARLVAYQAWFFATQGKHALARAVAQDALHFAKKISSGEGSELRGQIERFLDMLGDIKGSGALVDAWALFRRPFYVQGSVILLAIACIWYAVTSESTHPPYEPPPGPKPYMRPSDVYATAPRSLQSAYVRPALAPNGAPWPIHASYINRPLANGKGGHSVVTVDNSQNDNDVLVKLVSLSGSNAVPVRMFFIPARDRFTMNSVAPGSYDIRYQDLDHGGRSRSEAFTIQETETYNGIQYSNFTLTLYKVRNGNMKTYDLREDEF